MADPRLVNEWLEKAEEDFEFANSIIDDSTFYAQICFHFHQAAEKYLKTYIIACGLEFKKIHDLLVLLKSCSAIESKLQILQVPEPSTPPRTPSCLTRLSERSGDPDPRDRSEV